MFGVAFGNRSIERFAERLMTKTSFSRIFCAANAGRAVEEHGAWLE